MQLPDQPSSPLYLRVFVGPERDASGWSERNSRRERHALSRDLPLSNSEKSARGNSFDEQQRCARTWSFHQGVRRFLCKKEICSIVAIGEKGSYRRSWVGELSSLHRVSHHLKEENRGKSALCQNLPGLVRLTEGRGKHSFGYRCSLTDEKTVSSSIEAQGRSLTRQCSCTRNTRHARMSTETFVFGIFVVFSRIRWLNWSSGEVTSIVFIIRCRLVSSYMDEVNHLHRVGDTHLCFPLFHRRRPADRRCPSRSAACAVASLLLRSVVCLHCRRRRRQHRSVWDPWCPRLSSLQGEERAMSEGRPKADWHTRSLLLSEAFVLLTRGAEGVRGGGEGEEVAVGARSAKEVRLVLLRSIGGSSRELLRSTVEFVRLDWIRPINCAAEIR